MVLCRYYEGGVSSVYLWDLEDGGFAGVVLFKKSALCFVHVIEENISPVHLGHVHFLISDDTFFEPRTFRLVGLDPRF